MLHIVIRIIFPLSIIAPCSDGDLRLADGNVDNEGRVEICSSNVWGTVCDNSFSSGTDSQVVCRKLGYLTTGMEDQ